MTTRTTILTLVSMLVAPAGLAAQSPPDARFTAGVDAVVFGPLTFDGGNDFEIAPQVCLGFEPGVLPFARRLGGCLSWTSFNLSGGGDLTFFGIAPRYRWKRKGDTIISAALDLGFGDFDRPGYASQSFTSITAGAHFWIPVGDLPLATAVFPSLGVLHQNGYRLGVTDYPSHTDVIARLTVGMHLRFGKGYNTP